MKIIVRIAVVLLVLVMALVALGWALRDAILKRAAVQALSKQAGLEVEIGSVKSTVFPLAVQIRHLEIQSPPGFGETEAFALDEFYVSVDRKSFFTDEILLPEVRLRMPRLVVFQDEQGRTNWEQLGRQISQARRSDPPPERPPARIPSGDKPPTADTPAPDPVPAPKPTRGFRIGRLETYVGELEIHEIRPGESEPRIRRIPMEREAVFEDVTDLHAVMQQLALQWAAAALPALLEEARNSEDGDALRGLQDMLRRQRRARREQRDAAASP